MTRRKKLTVLGCWLPVVGLVAALFLVPSSSSGAAAPSLTVTPNKQLYGGMQTRWQGNIGSTGEQRIWLQRRGNTSSPWADVPDPRTGNTFTTVTDRRGEFDFFFPAPAMNFVYFRVAARSGATPAHLFQSKHQDAEFKVVEHNPAEVPLDQTLAIGTAVVDESFSLQIDTANGAGTETKPILPDRDVILQRRNSDGSWTTAGSGQLTNGGTVRFGPYDGTPGSLQVPGDYRVRLERYTLDGHDVGWFLSFPFDLRVVTRPQPVAGLSADPTSSQSVDLVWRLPADTRRDTIEIYRTMGADADDPSAANPWQRITPEGFAGTRTSYTDSGLAGGRTYKYAVYTVSPDGIYTRIPSRVSASTPADRR